MDTQISIEIRNWDYSECKLLSQTRNDVYLDSLSDNILFSFKESDNVYITFGFDDENVEIKYENYDDGEYLQIYSGQEIHFSTGREEFGCYYCGYFSICVTTKKKTYNLLFFVEPKNLKNENVLHLREYVNHFYNGLSTDILKKRYTNQVVDIKADNPNIYDNYMFIMAEFPKLMNSIQSYLKYKPMDAKKRAYISHNSKKITSKSIRWLAEKGMNKNENINSPDTMLINKIVLEIDTDDNQLFKRHLLFWMNEIKMIISAFENYKNNLNIDFGKRNQEIKELELKVDDMSLQRNIAQQIIWTNNDKIQRLKDNLKEIQSLIETYEIEINKLSSYKTSIENVLYNSWVKSVTLSNKVLSHGGDRRLKVFTAFQKDYLLSRSKHRGTSKKARILSFAEKCTPSLFETYNYILLINILRSLGFEVINNLDFENDNLMILFSKSSSIVLERDGLFCEIIYDRELEKSNGTFETSDYCYINSIHNRPDFILSFYEVKETPLNSMVVEVKWRPLGNIYNQVEDTNVVVNLRDYFNLAYHDHINRKTRRGVISKVLVVYPDEEERKTSIQEEEILALGLLPTKDIENSVGYLNLKNEIINLLNEI